MSKDRAFVRYTKKGKIVPGSLIISKTWPDGPGLWYEIEMDLCCITTTAGPIITTTTSSTTTTTIGPQPPQPPATTTTTENIGILFLRFSSISEGDTGVADPYSLSEWNTFFDLPTNGGPFTSVNVVGDTDVYLFIDNMMPGSQITTKVNLYKNNTNLLEVVDQGCIFSVGVSSFEGCTNLTSFSSDTCTTVDFAGFYSTTSLNSITLPFCTSLGDEVFYGSGLANVYFANVHVCGNNCFQAMPNLTGLDMPTLWTAGNYAFADNLIANNYSLLELNTAGEGFISNNPSISILDFPLLTQCGALSFADNVSLYYLNIPLVNDLGGSCADNSVFSGITGQTMDIYISFVVNTCNGGLPDDDIQWLQANNTVTLNVV